MPATRRSTRSSQQAGGKQSTLSFNNRVTKPVPKSAKKATTPVKASPLAKQPFKDEVKSEDDDVAKVEAPEVAATSQDVIEEKEQEEAPVEDDKSAAELRATKITDRQITGYWNKLEKERKAKRVHQGDLTLAEKVLRYFDVSSQYGPCVGISRMKRWKRADKLGLNPPAEVLAVLMKEEEKGTKGVEEAHMDYILNSTAIGAL
ncbi:hypothetical protein G7054_g11657 [Neopestalotiopsis clavispora]|nr:hypothetical protein G7054_g11657 [Neopestalotiopsis clavispora]